ncbi:MAG TPA: hypothetical protein VKW70_04750 [Terriglobia bacterium]|nr:hypothetical protein [Terriglobia bacterium]
MAAQRNARDRKSAVKSISSLLWIVAIFWGPLALGYAAAPIAWAGQGKSGEHGHGHQGQEYEGEHGLGNRSQKAITFGSREASIIRAYYGSHHQGLPPGLAKRGGNLPPGLEKHLERDSTLPPGLQKRLTPLPYDLERELPPLPRDCYCRRGVLGSNVLILNTRTGRIVDILQGVIAR